MIPFTAGPCAPTAAARLTSCLLFTAGHSAPTENAESGKAGGAARLKPGPSSSSSRSPARAKPSQFKSPPGRVIRQRLSALIRAYESSDVPASGASSSSEARAARRSSQGPGCSLALSHARLVQSSLGVGQGDSSRQRYAEAQDEGGADRCCRKVEADCRCGLRACRCAGWRGARAPGRHLQESKSGPNRRRAREAVGGRTQGARIVGARPGGVTGRRDSEGWKREREQVLRWLLQEVKALNPVMLSMMRPGSPPCSSAS